MDNNFLIGIDLGTQGTKAALFDISMNMIATAFESSRLISPKPGVVWQEAEDLYLSCANVIRKLVEDTGIKSSDIAAIGLDGQMAGIMGIYEDGKASTYYDSWLDMRCGTFADKIAGRIGHRIIELSGGAVSYTHGAKILWWKHEHPEIYKKTAKFVLPHAYIVCRMTGKRAELSYFDYTNLHFSNLADNAHKCWSEELINAFEIDKDKLPRIVSPFEVIGSTTEEFGHLSGTICGIPVVAGCGDTAASTFGSGMFAPGMVMDIAGTASVLCSVVNKYVPDANNATLTMMRSPIDGLILPLAYINGGGMCIKWCRDILGATYDVLEREAEKVDLGSEGLIFIPHFSGRVLPRNPYIKGSYLGLDFFHKRGHLYRSVMESIAYEYSCYLKVLKLLYPEYNFNSMISIGGGAKSTLFCQIKADVLGIRVETFEMGETALLGSAIIAGVGVGIQKDYKTPICNSMHKGSVYTPDEKRHALYTAPANNYLHAMGKLTGYYKKTVKK